MKNTHEILVSEVEISQDRECLIFHTRDNDDCGRLWCQLAGQLLDVTEGRKSIPYNMPEDTPPGTTLEVEGDTDQLLKLLTYLEVELEYYRFLAQGTTEQIQKQIESAEDSNNEPQFSSNL